MGMFNSIVTDFSCPKTNAFAEDVEIQIKWQRREARSLDTYHVGDSLPDLLPEYDNVWIRTGYICPSCSPLTVGRNGKSFTRTEDQRRHIAFAEVRDKRIVRILTEEEFELEGAGDFVDYL